MQIKSWISITLVSSAILVGCDQCGGKKPSQSETAALVDPSPNASAPSIGNETPSSEPNANMESTPPPAGETTMDSTTGTADPTSTATANSSDVPASASSETKIEVQTTDVKVGNGPEAVDGKRLTVHYTGTLENGTKFDSSKDRGTPFPFILGSGMVIAGWEKGLLGMKEGGIRKLVIPPSLAYGEKSVGGVIPPNSTLVFEIELLKVE